MSGQIRPVIRNQYNQINVRTVSGACYATPGAADERSWGTGAKSASTLSKGTCHVQPSAGKLGEGMNHGQNY